MVIVGGLVLLGVFLLAGRLFGGASALSMRRAAALFIPAWLVAALINMWVGISQAGYTVAQEAPILVVVFGVPAAIALVLWWRYGHA
jgi:hypothetical protein